MVRNDKPGVVWTVACLLLLVLMLVSAEALVDLALAKDHSAITFERAVQILRTSKDEELRNAARGAILEMGSEALRLLRADPDPRSRAVLEQLLAVGYK